VAEEVARGQHLKENINAVPHLDHLARIFNYDRASMRPANPKPEFIQVPQGALQTVGRPLEGWLEKCSKTKFLFFRKPTEMLFAVNTITPLAALE
jgi:hypothetical protein